MPRPLVPYKERIRELRNAGLDPQTIARTLNITSSAVYQNLAKIRAEEEAKTT